MTNEQEAESARLADALAAEFDREERGRPSHLRPAAAPTAETSRMPWFVAAVSVAVLLLQLPMLRGSFASKPSLHAGVAVDDSGAERCIDTLWEISALVQQGEPAETLRRLPFDEPVTHARYAITNEEGGIVVACPNPQAHGLTRLRVTENAAMPEASR